MGRAAAYLVLVSALVLSGRFTFAQTTLPAEDLKQTVEYLLDFVAKSDSVFIRNGQSHTPKEAADHMKAKYEYFKKQIKTPEDFIRLTATKSVLSRQPYLVRTRDGKEMKAADWLDKVLADYRARTRSALKRSGS